MDDQNIVFNPIIDVLLSCDAFDLPLEVLCIELYQQILHTKSVY